VNVKKEGGKKVRRNRLQALVEIRKLLHSTLKLDRILEIILDTALKNLTADRGTLYLIDYEKKELWSRVLESDNDVEIRFPIGKGIAGYVAKTGKKVIIRDAYKDSRFNPEFDKRTGFRTKTILCTPMKERNRKKIGVFQILNKRNGYFFFLRSDCLL
jgi:GAF domain-containing protein